MSAFASGAAEDWPRRTRAEARALDRRAIEELGLPSFALMESAGRACADAAEQLLGPARGPVLVLCGPGNNGGDGLVIARTLRNRGHEAAVALVGPAARFEQVSADVRANLALWRALGGASECFESEAALPPLLERLRGAALVVDALFGSGLDRPLGSPWLALVRELNAARRPVLAVDIPSGLDADSGAELGAAVRATETVTFIAAKPGFFRGQGPECCGRLRLAEIGIPRAWLAAAPAG